MKFHCLIKCSEQLHSSKTEYLKKISNYNRKKGQCPPIPSLPYSHILF